MIKKCAILLALIPALAMGGTAPADFVFMDSAARTYRSLHLQDDIYHQYGFNTRKVLVVLITPTLEDPRFVAQKSELKAIDFEKEAALLVIACAQRIYKHGYHTTEETASMLQARFGEFAVVVLDGQGNVLLNSSDKVTGASMVQLFAATK